MKTAKIEEERLSDSMYKVLKYNNSKYHSHRVCKVEEILVEKKIRKKYYPTIFQSRYIKTAKMKKNRVGNRSRKASQKEQSFPFLIKMKLAPHKKNFLTCHFHKGYKAGIKMY